MKRLVLATILTCMASAAAADAVPVARAGEWEADARKGSEHTALVKLCLKVDTSFDLDTLVSPDDGMTCTVTTVATSGKVTNFSQTCVGDIGVWTKQGTFTRTGADAFLLNATVRSGGPKGKDGAVTMAVRRLGPCQPGDIPVKGAP